MTKTDYNKLYSNKFYSGAADMLKFFIMPFVMFAFFGFPTNAGDYVQTLSKFAGPTFFVLSGFFILAPDKAVRRAKLVRAVKRSLVLFLVLLVVYSAFNILYFSYTRYDWAADLVAKNNIFNFLVFNIYPFPMGNSIWFIHSYFYAGLILLIADKCKVLTKPFFYIPALVLLFTVAICCGEFAKVFGFPYYSYNYIPGSGLTRAIPYMLTGMLIRKHANGILNIKRFVFIILFAAGLGLAAAEYYLLKRCNLLAYSSHMAGFFVMAASVCCFALSDNIPRDSFIAVHGRSYAKRIYYLCQPVAWFVTVLISTGMHKRYRPIANDLLPLIVYVICLLLAYAVGRMKFAFFLKNEASFLKSKSDV